MARVLCAWEFGGDLGHVRRWMPIARELRSMGHEPLLVFRDIAPLGEAARESFDGLQAPLLRMPARQNPSPLNASDILLNLGYDDPPGLAGALRAWLSLVELAKPDLVVADYAPTALLAARASRLPRLTIGTGFSVPRLADPLPSLRDWSPSEEDTLRRLDARLVSVIAKAFERLPRAGPAPRRARELFDAEAHLLCTFPELDPFGPRDGVEYLGPQGDATSGTPARWERPGPHVFAYLKPRDPRFGAVIEGLRSLRAEVLVAAPGIDEAQARALSSASLHVHRTPLDLEALLPGADLCVSHAGPGLAARACVAGVPLALLPMQLEQYLVARRLVASGTSRMISPDEPPRDYGPWLAEALEDEGMQSKAREHAAAHGDYRFEEAARRTARRIAATVAA